MPLRIPLGFLVQQRAGRSWKTGIAALSVTSSTFKACAVATFKLRLPATVVIPRISSSGELSTKNNAIASSCGGKAKSVSKMIFCAGCARGGSRGEQPEGSGTGGDAYSWA